MVRSDPASSRPSVADLDEQPAFNTPGANEWPNIKTVETRQDESPATGTEDQSPSSSQRPKERSRDSCKEFKSKDTDITRRPSSNQTGTSKEKVVAPEIRKVLNRARSDGSEGQCTPFSPGTGRAAGVRTPELRKELNGHRRGEVKEEHPLTSSSISEDVKSNARKTQQTPTQDRDDVALPLSSSSGAGGGLTRRRAGVGQGQKKIRAGGLQSERSPVPASPGEELSSGDRELRKVSKRSRRNEIQNQLSSVVNNINEEPKSGYAKIITDIGNVNTLSQDVSVERAPTQHHNQASSERPLMCSKAIKIPNKTVASDADAKPASMPSTPKDKIRGKALEVPNLRHDDQQRDSSSSHSRSRKPPKARKPRERAQSQNCALESREHGGDRFWQTVKTVMSSKSEPPRREGSHKEAGIVSKDASNTDDVDATGELASLASRLDRLLQETDDLDFFAEKRYLGSCEWLLDEPLLADFLQQPKQTHLLWCTGRPGSGKSVFASSVIHHLRDNDANCAFYFFRFGNEAQNGLSSFLVSVAYQFAAVIPQYRTRLNQMFEQGLSIQKSAPRLIWQKLFTSTLLKMDIGVPLYLVIDGLDECDASALLLKLLADTPNSKSKLCIMLVSRKTQALSVGFDKLSRSAQIETFSLEDVDEDIRMYVEEEMQSMRGDQNFKDRISERILAKADGNFLWATLVLKEVLQCHTETEIENALNDVPEDLEQLYEQMDATLARNSRPADHTMARMILTWAVCSRHRLNLQQLSEALQPEYAEVLDLRLTIGQVCGEFVVVDTKGIVGMVHATARDFLTENKKLNFHVSAAESHQKIFTKCLSELIASSSKIQMGQTKPGSFLPYAATSWAYHLNLACTHLDQDSLLLLVQFFRGPAVLSWIHLLSLSNQLGVLVQASKIMTSFLKLVDRLDSDRSPLTHRLQEKDALSLWTVDLVRLVGKFGFHLRRQPKSIYKLIPAFCPPASAMHKTFCSRAPQMSLAVTGISSPSWDDCLAKFAVASKCLPIAVTSVNRHFAILTSDGTVHLYNSSTLEEGKRFKHGERVLAWCFNQTGDRLVTYGFLKTIVWNVTSGLQLFSLANPSTAKAIAVGFTSNDESIVTCSDDRHVRCASLRAGEVGWQILENVFGSDVMDADQHNSPRCVAFNALGSQLAIGYRGFALSVWSVDEPRPCLIGRCERQASAGQIASGTFVDTQAICWNTVTGHVLGIYNDGCIFKWHPFEGEYQESKVAGSDVKCSPDGKFFVTSSSDGSLRVWDFQHFSQIYQVSCPSSVTDLAIDPIERRIYDIRESFCNIWEPNALLRLWETDDKGSDTNSTRESSTQVSTYSETSGEAFEPLTALAVDRNTLNYSTGNDEGVVTYYSREGEVISELSQTFMTVEHISWSDNGTCVASSDLSRRVIVKSVDPTCPNAPPKPLLTVKIEDPIMQLLLSPLGEYLLVSTETCLTIWSIEKKKHVSTREQTARYYWTNSPSDPEQLIGFGYSELQISMWEGMGTTWELKIDRSAVDSFSALNGVHAMFPKPTAQFKTSDGEIERAVDKVLFALDGSVALVETSQSSTNHSREKQFMLIAIDPESIIEAIGSKTMVIQPKILPSELVSRLGLPLGFVISDPIQTVRRRSYASSPHSADPSRKSFLTPQSVSTNSWRTSSSTFLTVGEPLVNTGSEHVLAFLDHEYWVCTYVLADGRPGRVRRHHFLPRDWINMDCLELAVMRSDGSLLCPRNGEVAIVTGGLKDECLD